MSFGIKLAREMSNLHPYLRPLQHGLLPLGGRRLDGLPPLEHRVQLVRLPRAHPLQVSSPLALLLLAELLRGQGLK